MGQDQSLDSSSGNSPQAKPRAKLDDIIVVSRRNKPNTEEICDEDIQHLKSLPLSNPILQQFSGNDIEYVKVPRISSVSFTEMLLRYQFHLTECAEAVSFDQNALSKRIKEVNALAAGINRNFNERYKNVESVISQLEKVSEITSMIEKIELNLKNTKEQFNTLNNYLPKVEQITDPEFTC